MPSLRDLRSAFSGLVFAALLVPLAAKAEVSTCPGGGPLANSPVGPICGFSSNLPIQGLGTVSASAFLGIPYAQPPVGDLRWHSPQPLQTMGGYWAAFGTNQNPNGGGRPNWPLFSGAINYLTLVQPPVAAADPFAKAAHCDLWESIGYPAPGMGEALQKLLKQTTR